MHCFISVISVIISSNNVSSSFSSWSTSGIPVTHMLCLLYDVTYGCCDLPKMTVFSSMGFNMNISNWFIFQCSKLSFGLSDPLLKVSIEFIILITLWFGPRKSIFYFFIIKQLGKIYIDTSCFYRRQCTKCDIVQEAVIKTIPKKRKCKKAKWLSEEALQTVKKRS